MTIHFACPACGSMASAPDGSGGQQFRCGRCGQTSAIPGKSAAVAPEAPPPRPMPPPPPGPYGRPRDDYAPAGPPPPASGKATVSVVFGALSLLGGLLFGIPAIILGVMAKKDIARSGGLKGGEGLATVGIVMGICSLALTLVAGVLLALLLPAVATVREAAGDSASKENLREMALCMWMYDEEHKALPPDGAIKSPDGRPLLSWRVALLPQLYYTPLYKRFRLDEPWDSDHNRQFLDDMPKIFHDPLDGEDAKMSGMTRYRAVTGRHSAFVPGGRVGNIPDGASQTIMLVETEEMVPWTKPDEFVYDPNGPLPQFSKRLKRGFNLAFWDGSVRTVPPKTPADQLRAAFTARGNEQIFLDW